MSSLFFARVGIQFFADGAQGAPAEGTPAGEPAAAGGAQDGDAFLEGLTGAADGPEDTPEAPEDDRQTAPDDRQDQPAGEPAAAAGTQEGGSEGLPRDQPAGESPAQDLVQTVQAEIGGSMVQLPAQALQALSDALGMDAAALLQRGAAREAGATREAQILSDYATAAGMELPAYLNFLEHERDEQLIRREMENIRGRYPEGTPDAALHDIAKSSIAQQRAQQAETARQRQDEARQMMQRATLDVRMREQNRQLGAFLKDHPEIRGSKDVPQAVWELVRARGMTVPAAYAIYERDQARSESAELREQLKIANKQNNNRATSAGSQQGGGDQGDPFLQGLFG